MKQKMEMRNINSITVLNLIPENPDLSEYLLIVYPNLIDFRLFILQYTKKKTIKTYILLISIFYWLEIEQIEKILIEISKSELSIEKTI